MNRLKSLNKLRAKLKSGPSIGSWMQIPNGSVAEIMGAAGYDWIAADLEHGSISVEILPDLFRALELGNTLPLARIAQGSPKDCKQALDAGAAGVIIPMVNSADQLENCIRDCRWPPAGQRGVGFSRANLFGKNFESYREEAQSPLVVAQIEHFSAVQNMEEILSVKGLDAIMIGPYDLSASLGRTAEFNHPEVKSAIDNVLAACTKSGVPAGFHVVQPNVDLLKQKIAAGFRFIAYSIDAVLLNESASFEKLSGGLQ